MQTRSKSRLRLSRALPAALVAVLPALLLSAATTLAAGCFPDVYYEFLFKPNVQDAQGGDARLVGLSDYLAAKGEDPHSEGTGSGCMCGVNNGRWDQMLMNASPDDAAQAPVAFRINRIEGKFTQKDVGPKGKTLVIDAGRLKKCFGVGLKVDGHLAFDSPAGLSKDSDILEQGENFLGCLCLEPALQQKSGQVMVQVDYTPLVISGKLNPDGGFKGLPKGHALYYRIKAPAGAAGLEVGLDGAKNAEIYWRPAGQPWAPAMSDWTKGPLKAAPSPDQAPYWLMVRAVGGEASGMLKVSAGAQGLAETVEVPGAGRRTFKAYMLGLGSEPKKKNKLAETETKKMPCCSPQ